ncbi:MAG TPA: glycosyltransferase family 1 protein [Nitrospirae bacterium]|nr:N, N'-diacetylbacillosaminyl-diphospho-undecaprenol alpha-1,3-N-acetylgalactosaminyltransferase [bacterium BMS3Abin06]HDH13558.1 glycosyltransferase family 1 protein [Nitrospirota bacterium]HDZ01002.1 glycosyltransferase family 1 protein [Nitrospirota bacterium]
MKKAKYNILFTSCFSSLRGGGQRSLYLLIKHLDKERFTPFLIVPGRDELSEEITKSGVKIFVLPFPRIRSFNLFLTVSRLINLWRIIKKERIDLIHTESPRETFYAALAGKLCRLPVILHLRVSDSFLWLDRILFNIADSMIAVSQSAANRFKLIDKKDKIRVVYNGVELDMFRPLTKYEDNEFLRIGYFGRVEKRKGIEVLVRAVSRLSEKVELIIMGDGDRQYLEELKSLSVNTNVVFKDYKRDILDDIAAVDVVVLPSFKGEGLSRIIIESMAMGKTVIASDLSANKEALGEDLKEFLFPAGDDLELASIIEKIIKNRQILRDMREKVRSRAEHFFDIKKNTKEIEKLYNSLMAVSQ